MEQEIKLNFSSFSKTLLFLESEIIQNPQEFFQKLRNFVNCNQNNNAPINELWIQEYISWLDAQSSLPLIPSNTKVKRLYMDGCFDLVHSGHFNAIRQAKALAETLVIGVIPNDAIEQAKGMTIMSLDERITLIKNCKWVDEVVVQNSYVPTLELIDEFKCSHIAHGGQLIFFKYLKDDLIVDGNGIDVYSPFQQANRFKIFKRTAGISTTEIVGRLLENALIKILNCQIAKYIQQNKTIQQQQSPNGCFIKLFINQKQTDKIIYIQGSFDILRFLNSGHVKFLQKAKEQGTFLLVGVYSDEEIRETKGKQYPILSLEERILNVLASRYVDEIIIGVPIAITQNIIKNFNINKIIATDLYECNENELDIDPYEVPKSLGIYQFIQCESSIRLEMIMDKIKKNYLKLEEAHAKKTEKLKNYYSSSKPAIQEIDSKN